MKKTILLISLLMAMAAVVMAQKPETDHRHRGKAPVQAYRQNKVTADSLELTQEQKKQFLEIQKAFTEEKDAISKSRIVPAMQQEKLKALREKRESDIANLLTAEQKQEWDNRELGKLLGRHYRGESRWHNQRLRDSRNRLALKGLGLTDAQKEELKKMEREHKITEMKLDLKHDEEVKQLREKKKEAIKNILTDEQKQKFDEKQKGSGKRHSKMK